MGEIKGNVVGMREVEDSKAGKIFLTDEEALRIELFQEQMSKIKSDAAALMQKKEVKEMQIKNLELNIQNIKTEISMVQMEIGNKRDALESKANSYRDYTSSIAKKYSLPDRWGFDNETKEIKVVE